MKFETATCVALSNVKSKDDKKFRNLGILILLLLNHCSGVKFLGKHNQAVSIVLLSNSSSGICN